MKDALIMSSTCIGLIGGVRNMMRDESHLISTKLKEKLEAYFDRLESDLIGLELEVEDNIQANARPRGSLW